MDLLHHREWPGVSMYFCLSRAGLSLKKVIANGDTSRSEDYHSVEALQLPSTSHSLETYSYTIFQVLCITY